MKPSLCNVDWHATADHDILQLSGLLCGLATLDQTGNIELSVKAAASPATPVRAVMRLTVAGPSGTRRKVAIDFHDREDLLFTPELAWCDLYLKRQHGVATRAAAGPLVQKLRPLGLTMAGFTWGAAVPLASLLAKLSVLAAGSGASWSLVRRAAYAFRLWASHSPPTVAEAQPSDRKRPEIVFQPRLWGTSPGSGDVFDIANRDRIDLVALLRRTFPHMEGIGLTRTSTAGHLAPHLQLQTKVTTRKYYSQLRTAAVTVNCDGLAGSVGWKLAEYLAAGCAVVSQPITKNLPTPLQEGVHYLSYRSPAECAAQCRRLLDTPDLADSMGRANLRYYHDHVRPDSLAKHVIGLALT